MTARDLTGRASTLADRAADAANLADLLATIDERERDVNAFVHLDPDLLGEQSEHVHLDPVPRLAGQVVAVKDNIAVRGAPWAAGSASRLGNPADHDAELVRRLRAAGAVIVGTTNLDELAMGASTESSYLGPSHNPWDLARTPGGSSGGSAAAVAAYGVLAVGSDTGGSIREPASQCGVVGVKPSRRAIPQDGVVPFAPSCDEVGPLGVEIGTTAVLDEVLRGSTGLCDAVVRGARTQRLTGVRLGVVMQQSDGRNSPEVRRRFERVLALLESAGAELNEVSFPSISESLSVYLDITSVEALPVLAEHESLGVGLGEEAARRLEHARSILRTRRLNRARQTRHRIRRQLLAAADHYYALLSPTMPTVAPLLGAAGLDDPLGVPRTDWWTVEANLAGLGAMSLPAGIGSDSGLPIGVQIMSAPGRDQRLYALGAWLQTAGAND